MNVKKSSAVENARPGANLESLLVSVYGTTRCHAVLPSLPEISRQYGRSSSYASES